MGGYSTEDMTLYMKTYRQTHRDECLKNQRKSYANNIEASREKTRIRVQRFREKAKIEGCK